MTVGSITDRGSTVGVLPAYSEAGSGEPLILIMGLGADGGAWRPHVDAWARRFRCIMVDNRGTGRTPDTDGPHTIEALSDDVARLMDRLGLRDARVIGVSMGSAIAQQLMLSRPDLVSRSVLIATWSRVSPSVGTIFESIDRAAQHRDTGLLRRLLHTVTWTFDWSDAHPEQAREKIEDRTPIPFATVSKQARACAAFDVVERLGEIAVPTLVTLGVQDLIIHPHLSRQTARLIDGAETIEYATGHVHHFEEVQKFNHDVLEWIT